MVKAECETRKAAEEPDDHSPDNVAVGKKKSACGGKAKIEKGAPFYVVPEPACSSNDPQLVDDNTDDEYNHANNSDEPPWLLLDVVSGEPVLRGEA